MWGFNSIEMLWQDLRYGAADAEENSGFALLAVLVTGPRIGANTAVFSLINAVFLRPLAKLTPHQSSNYPNTQVRLNFLTQAKIQVYQTNHSIHQS